MFSFVFGLPGRFMGWCEQITAVLVESDGGTGRLMRADTLRALALAAVENGVSAAAVSSGRPGGRLRAAVVDSGRNFVVVVEDPRTALAELAFGQDVDWADAVQQIASGCAALRGLATAPGALTLLRDRDWSRPIENLQLKVDPRALPGLLSAVATVAPPAAAFDAAARWRALSAAQQELAWGALASFVEDDEAAAATPVINWRPELFFYGDQPQQRVGGAIDITGRARCLVQGPDIRLPAGSWSLSLTARLLHGAAEHEFAVELGADRPLVSGTIRSEREGSATVALEFDIDDLAEEPVALRISSQRAAFDGAIDLIGATLVRASAPPASATA
jgi:hypothetical protein